MGEVKLKEVLGHTPRQVRKPAGGLAHLLAACSLACITAARTPARCTLAAIQGHGYLSASCKCWHWMFAPTIPAPCSHPVQVVCGALLGLGVGLFYPA